MRYKRVLFASVLSGIIIMASTVVNVSGTPPARLIPSIPTPVEILPDVATAASCTNLANWQCVETRPGLSLCRANNVCVVKADLNSNTLQPRVVIAPGGGTDWLSNMASREGAVVAINGDYFSGCPDPNDPRNCGEGLTFVNGVDYTRYEYDNWQNRRSLGFSDNYDPNIGWPSEQGGYHRMLLGGGPQVSFNGEYRWRCWYQGYNTEGNCACQNNTVVINDELFGGCSANNWWNRPQTFIGFSDDRNTLYLAVSEPGYNKTPHEMHDVLWVLGSRYSLKMDGGGSSGMYFNDGGYSFAWNGSRAVANAWVIVPYSVPPPTATPPSSCDATSLPSGYVKCADENGYCSFSGTQQVYYGANSCFKVRSFTDGVGCNNGNFGDPLPGVSKACYVPASCNPSADQVALYANTNYGGACVTLGIGDYPNPGHLTPVGNDNAESIRVGGNVRAILCEHDNYQGQCEIFLVDDANLGDNPIGANRVSSVQVQNRPIPTSTPTPTPPVGIFRNFLALVQKSDSSSMVNGSFENGTTGWTEYSSHGWSLIMSADSLPVNPHSGNWAVWLGGDNDEISYIAQQIRVPSDQPYLTYWHWISSDESGCNWDYGKVMVNEAVVDAYGLCLSTNTGGWVPYSVNLSAYAGQVVSVQIRAETDSSINSNLFVDDVSFRSQPLPSMSQSSNTNDNSKPRSSAPK